MHLTISLKAPLLLFSFMILITACKEEDEVVKNGQTDFTPVTQFNDWTPIVTGLSEDLNDVYFSTNDLGWIAGNDKTLISTASGNVGWSLTPVESPIENIKALYFINESTGWIVGDIDGDPVMGQVGFSSNGGSYPQQQVITENPLNSVIFLNNQEGWAAGANGLMIQTFNGGVDWETVTPFTTDDIHDIQFTEPENGWIVTSNGGIYHTTDGINWNKDSMDITADLLAIHFTDSNHGWACGASNTILRAEIQSESLNWIPLIIEDVSPGQQWNDIFFIDETTGWVAGEKGTVYKTEDGGNTWESEASNVFNDLNSIYMIDKNTGWIVGEMGSLISYSPGD